MDSIRGRLWIGFGILVALILAAGGFALTSLRTVANDTRSTLLAVEEEAMLTSQLTASVTQTLEAGSRYIETRDSTAERAFRQAGWQAHALQGKLNGREGQNSRELEVIASIDTRLSDIEVDYARAHRMVDLGRQDEGHSQASTAQSAVDALLGDINRLGQLKAQKVNGAADLLGEQTSRRSKTLVALILAALAIGVIVVIATVRSIGRPLDILVAQARRLSEGDLTARTTEQLPGEFQILGAAMNQTGDSLSRVVTFAARTAENVAASAHQLSSVSEQISISAGQMADAMSEVSHGAETQVQQLRTVDDTLTEIREAAAAVKERSGEVTSLASEIESQASQKRHEIERALGILKDVKAGVESAAAEVSALNTTTAEINRFVASVSQIADQTNLLALNAAIEAARAGEHGRGFAVVADEVRKLAEQSQRAADDIVQMTSVVTARVTSSARAMETGASKVGEIERVSREIDDALRVIGTAAERTRVAANGVSSAADANAAAVGTASASIDDIAKTAESHAAAAEQVNASTQEQSAACQEMTSASNLLLQSSTQLKELVGGLRT
ncbi:MAG: hypothetical protein JWO05_2561 [Gemmatimonadetes bacterium]|nr:hypothetical protein [Gemmatimonadota bacterium]